MQLSERDGPGGIFGIKNHPCCSSCVYVRIYIRVLSLRTRAIVCQRESARKSGEKGKEVPRSTGSG